MIVLLVVVLVLFVIALACIAVAEILGRRKAEREANLAQLQLVATIKVSEGHEAWLRSLVERGFDGADSELAHKRDIIEKLVTPQPITEPPEGVPGWEDPRLEVRPEDTADWADFDPALAMPFTNGMLGDVPEGFPAPSAEEYLDG